MRTSLLLLLTFAIKPLNATMLMENMTARRNAYDLLVLIEGFEANDAFFLVESINFNVVVG
jgi:hypothetical protein